jgi:hypothetical protein
MKVPFWCLLETIENHKNISQSHQCLAKIPITDLQKTNQKPHNFSQLVQFQFFRHFINVEKKKKYIFLLLESIFLSVIIYQYNTIQYNTPSKHKNFLHTSSYLIILLISNKALNITKIILPI